MSQRLHNFFLLFMAFLIVVPCLAPSAGQAEALMRCAGKSSSVRPCARVLAPAAGLTPRSTYRRLMACCRGNAQGCTLMRRACPMTGTMTGMALQKHRVQMPRCLVSISITPDVSKPVAALRSRWLLSAMPSQAPPPPPIFAVPAKAASLSLQTSVPILPPHILPFQHGLRAPPAA